MYVLKHDDDIIVMHTDLKTLWKMTVHLYGHMTLANFTERGFAIDGSPGAAAESAEEATGRIETGRGR